MKKIFVPLFILLACSLSAQDLEQHRWQNRLLVIIDNENPSIKRHKQLSTFEKKLNGLKERKLLIYQFTSKGYKVGLEQKEWSEVSNNRCKFLKKKAPFTLLLIGLDGGVKMEKRKVVALEQIFAFIDGMPMRRAELRKY